MLGTQASFLTPPNQTDVEITVKEIKTTGFTGRDQTDVQEVEVPLRAVPQALDTDTQVTDNPDSDEHPGIAKITGGDMVFGLYDSGTSMFDSDIFGGGACDN